MAYVPTMRGFVLSIVFAIFFVLTAAQLGAAQSPQDRARDALRSGQIRPLNEVLSVVQSRYPGRVMDVDLQKGPRWVYRVKLLTRGGDVMVVAVDARTTQILSVRGGGKRGGRRRRR